MAVPTLETIYNRQDLPNSFWWEKRFTSKEVWKPIVAAVGVIDSAQRSWRLRNRINIGMYSETMLRKLGYGNLTGMNSYPDGRMKLNVIRSCVDTATSYIGSQKPRVFNLTSDGDWSAQKRAKNLNQFMDGIFYHVEQYEKSSMIFQHAAIMGTGFAKPFINDDDLMDCDTVLCENVLIDEREMLFRDPRTIYQYDEFSRDVLMERYPGNKDLKNATCFLRDFGMSSDKVVSDMVSVVEAWHIGANGKGRHSIITDSCTLLDEVWEKKYCPLVPMRWSKMPYGYFGQGLADILYSIQIEINYLCAKIQTLMTLATTQVFIEAGSKVNKQGFTNTDFAIHEYSGTPPVFHAVQAVSPEYFTQLRDYYQLSFELAGISQLSAQASKPAGLNSGKALVEYNDVQSRRFLDISNRYDNFHVKLSDIYCDLVNDVYERTGKYSVLAKGKRSVDLIDWSEIKLDRDKMISMPFPTSFFANTPSGKWEQVQQMLQEGFLEKDQAASLMDYPDLDAVTSTLNAPYDYLKLCVEQIVEHGEYHSPDPNSNLNLAMMQLPKEIMRALVQHVPEERVDLLRRYEDEVSSLLQTQEDRAREQQFQLQQAQMAAQAQNVPPQASQIPPQLAQQLMPGVPVS